MHRSAREYKDGDTFFIVLAMIAIADFQLRLFPWRNYITIYTICYIIGDRKLI